MEREDSYRMIHDLSGDLKAMTPTADYHCENCGSDYEWQQGKKHLIRSFDSQTQEYRLPSQKDS